MARRDYFHNKKCAHDGCTEHGRWRAETRHEYLQTVEAHKNWRCVRHSKPEEVLSADNPERVTELTSRCTIDGSEARFWGHNGFVFGPGFKAYADDFPPGTKLIITARIELP